MTVHDLKCIPRYYNAVIAGEKPFEVRKNDRDFRVGDEVRLREFDWRVLAPSKAYTGRECMRRITYVLKADDFTGVQPGYCVLGLSEPEVRPGDWFCTYTGKQIYVLDPRPEDIDVVDIAHALAMTCRYNGHIRRFYSVAQHSVLVSYHVPHELEFAGLLHDAAEAYLGDVIRPLKVSLPDYKDLERLWEQVIGGVFDVEMDHPAVKEADRRMLITERRDLACAGWYDHEWKEDEKGYEPFNERIAALDCKLAEEYFLARFDEVKP